MFIGGALAVVVLLLFLRSGSATGIVAVAIPISVVGTFLVIAMLGRTLNVIMLAGMAFAVGMVVDTRDRRAGETSTATGRWARPGWRRPSTRAREVWGAILASTLTTMAVFLPVIFIEEEAGQLFKDIAIAIASAVGLSLVVSILVIPPLASRFFSASRAVKTKGDRPWFFARWVSLAVGWINRSVTARVAVVAGVSCAAVLGQSPADAGAGVPACGQPQSRLWFAVFRRPGIPSRSSSAWRWSSRTAIPRTPPTAFARSGRSRTRSRRRPACSRRCASRSAAAARK